MKRRVDGAVDAMVGNRLREARLRVRWALWRTDNHPQALAAAAQIWLASGRYEQALDFAERAYTRLSFSQADSPSRRLQSEAAVAGGLACCWLRNHSQDPQKRRALGCEAMDWFRILADLDPEALADVVKQPALRDLSAQARALWRQTA